VLFKFDPIVRLIERLKYLLLPSLLRLKTRIRLAFESRESVTIEYCILLFRIIGYFSLVMRFSYLKLSPEKLYFLA
jgi:hypothetical protein